MCGIVGYAGKSQALPFLIEGLSRLEYRGYDSAGVAVIEDGEFFVARAMGKLEALRQKLSEEQGGARGTTGIGHTRWATHGRPSENNAHPHTAGSVSLIHNGIIENYLEIRKELEAKGVEFLSETDTEIAAQLLGYNRSQGMDPLEALRETCKRIEGSYAFVAVDRENPGQLLVAKNATPIVIGLADDEVYVASDIPAILDRTRRVVILEDGDLALISPGAIQIEANGQAVERKEEVIQWDPVTAQKGGYKHFMLKEIHEQPLAVTETFRARLNPSALEVVLEELDASGVDFTSVSRVVLVACGTAWHACLVIKQYIESLAKVPCEVDYASEFRYREVLLDENALVMCVSQSGETADTLAAIELAKQHCKTGAICNVLGSSITRRVDFTVFTQAGPEISVASTKAFTTQLTAGMMFALYFAQKRGVLSSEDTRTMVDHLLKLPGAIEKAVESEEDTKAIAKTFHGASDFLYLARGLCYPIALEGALKLKEISYIHAEGYPAGEMKHGPIALIDEEMPVVVVLQRSELAAAKTVSNLREVESRAGKIILVTDMEVDPELRALCEDVIEVPFLSEFLSPIVLTVPLQLLAYFIAVEKGTDVDLPRNLAKSVTVE